MSPGHLLIVPRRHIPTWFDASQEQREALMAALGRARDLLADRHHPDGYNIGRIVGKAAGQTVSTCTSTPSRATKATCPTPAAASATSSPTTATRS